MLATFPQCNSDREFRGVFSLGILCYQRLSVPGNSKKVCCGIHFKTFKMIIIYHTVMMQRNGLPEASRGDKSYQSPEYSSDFHKHGSTLPIPNFG